MLDILSRSIARAGGIEVADHVRIVPRRKPGKSVLRLLAGAFRRYRARKSALKALSRLDDRLLCDIGLHRGILSEAADRFVELQAANDNADQPRSACLIPVAAGTGVVGNGQIAMRFLYNVP